jgi:hypothetical protein
MIGGQTINFGFRRSAVIDNDEVLVPFVALPHRAVPRSPLMEFGIGKQKFVQAIGRSIAIDYYLGQPCGSFT